MGNFRLDKLGELLGSFRVIFWRPSGRVWGNVWPILGELLTSVRGPFGQFGGSLRELLGNFGKTFDQFWENF